MNKNEFNYYLPENLIAQTPVYPRDSSKMLVYDRHNQTIFDKHFYDLCDFVRSGDVLVINETKVLPARLFGEKPSGGKVEFLLHKRLNLTDWEVLVRPAKRTPPGTTVNFGEKLSAVVTDYGEGGTRLVRFSFDGVFEDIISNIGEMPLPHYIHKKLTDQERYQTVYAKEEGSSAAPTAGLHFTQELLEKLQNKGVEIVKVLLHVGLGTFRPVKEEDVTKHKMHSEFYSLSQESATRINKALDENRRIIAVGTTSVRVLESAADENNRVKASNGNTEIFIYPPYEFKIVKALITNFHLPESTLIMLVSAFCGRERTLELYEYAVKNEYRFFSFGDAMLIL